MIDDVASPFDRVGYLYGSRHTRKVLLANCWLAVHTQDQHPTHQIMGRLTGLEAVGESPSFAGRRYTASAYSVLATTHTTATCTRLLDMDGGRGR